MGLEIRPCLESEIPDLFHLFAGIYRYNPNLVKKDYFDWFYKETPFSDRKGYEFYVIKESNVIKAFVGCLPIEYRLDGRVERGCWINNWHTLASGFYGLQLWNHLKEVYGTIFLMDLTEESERIFKLMGIQIVDRLPRWVGVLDQESCHTILGHTKEFWGQFPSLSCRAGKEVVPIHRFDEVEEFFLEESLGVRGYCRRTGAFLNWRFKDIPGHNYQMIRSSNGGYAVFRIEKIMGYDRSVTRIIEWTFDQRLSQEALGLVCQASRLENSILIDFFSSVAFPGSCLESCGFLAERNMDPLVPRLFRPVKSTSGISFGIDMSRQIPSGHPYTDWYMTTADLDSERIKL